MVLSELKPERADALFQLNIPDILSPIHIRILWLDNLTFQTLSHRNAKMGHSHSFFEIQFVFSGNLVYDCDGKNIKIEAGQALLIPPGVTHRHIHADKELEKAVLAFSVEPRDSAELFPEPICRLFYFSSEIIENINYLLKKSDERDLFSPVIFSGRILEILVSALHSMEIRLPTPYGPETDSRVRVAKAYIEANQNRAIYGDDVARECCLSLKHLNRIFKEEMDCSVSEYIAQTRIGYAKKLLLHGERSIKEIAYLMGFDTESSFVSFFKRHCGTAPGEYRKQNCQIK